MKIDVEKVKKCREHYQKASELLKEIEEEVAKLFQENGDSLVFREDTFEPFWWAEEGELMRWKGCNGLVVIDEEGNMTYRKHPPIKKLVEEWRRLRRNEE